MHTRVDNAGTGAIYFRYFGRQLGLAVAARCHDDHQPHLSFTLQVMQRVALDFAVENVPRKVGSGIPKQAATAPSNRETVIIVPGRFPASRRVLMAS